MTETPAVRAARAIVEQYGHALRRGGAILLGSVEKRIAAIIQSEFSSVGLDAQVAQRLADIGKRQDLRRLNHKVFKGSTEALDDIDYLLSLVDTARPDDECGQLRFQDSPRCRQPKGHQPPCIFECGGNDDEQ